MEGELTDTFTRPLMWQQQQQQHEPSYITVRHVGHSLQSREMATFRLLILCHKAINHIYEILVLAQLSTMSDDKNKRNTKASASRKKSVPSVCPSKRQHPDLHHPPSPTHISHISQERIERVQHTLRLHLTRAILAVDLQVLTHSVMHTVHVRKFTRLCECFIFHIWMFSKIYSKYLRKYVFVKYVIWSP